MTNNRRSFIAKATAYSSTLMLSGCKSLGQNDEDSVISVAPVDPRIPKRVSWMKLSEDDKKSFIDAVQAMTMRSIALPPAGIEMSQWQAVAGTHIYFCVHGTGLFLPWHRSYLYYFELHLRALIRDSFRLPYWDWTADTDVPEELQAVSLLNAAQVVRDNNSLSQSGRPGDPATEAWWRRAGAELARCPDYDTIGGDSSSSGFLESPYHNMVHTGIGGDMGQVPQAAKDPIFWLHHCNVDRLWSMWMDEIIAKGQLRQLFPATQVKEWLGTRLAQQFVLPNGSLVSTTIREALFSHSAEYSYDTVKSTWVSSDVPGDMLTEEFKVRIDGVSASATPGLNLLANPDSSIKVKFNMPMVFSLDHRLQSLRLIIRGIPELEAQNLIFAVYLLIAKQSLALAEIAFFPGSEHHRSTSGIGLSLDRYMSRLESLTQEAPGAELALFLQDKSHKPVAIKTALPDFDYNSPGIEIMIKAVYQ